jgi:hypothetical protein
MFSVITNIYKKKTKGPTLMELFTATGKLKKLFLTTRDVRWVHHGWHGPHRYDIQVLAKHAATWVHRCVPCHPWCTHRTSLVVKKNFFSFPVAVNNSIKVGPLVLLVINVCNNGGHYETPCTMCGQNTELIHVTDSGTYSYPWELSY